ncbi:golgin subfamily A member 2 isoform X3 [Folsomia candida]|uniref:golgin subfamily A member 2 isoform X3 n=1 Tax=Folsomia candida TaxID=158441 RepID=UPI000B909B43|nr:golgin subfamily A member 2 isoform X3 [Folsomia candida]
MDKKNLSAARRKLEEYKLHKASSGVQKTDASSSGHHSVEGGTTFTEINETYPRPPETTEQVPAPIPYFHPPPTENIPTFLNNLGTEMQSIHMEGGQDLKVLNMSTPSSVNSTDFNNSTFTTVASPASANNNGTIVSPFSEVSSQQMNDHIFTPPLSSTMFDQENPQPIYDHKQEQFTDAGQNFPPNFFQSTPISHDHHHHSKSPYEPQDFYYNLPQPSAPLFFNVNGGFITPQHQGTSLSNIQDDPESQSVLQEKASPNSMEETMSRQVVDTHSLRNGENCDENNDNNRNSLSTEKPKNVHFNISQHDLPDNIPLSMEEPSLKEVTLQRMSPSSMQSADIDVREIQAFQRLKSVQDALEMQLEESRRDNERLLNRQAELLLQLEDNDKNVQELRRERDRSKEDAKKLMQPLTIKFNNLYEENQRSLKNSNDVGMELRSKLQEKSKQYEDMEQAFIIVSKSKMDLAAELDQEKEKSKELETQLLTRDECIVDLRNNVAKLEEKIKVEQQKDGIIHQLEDQIRHYQVQSETLQRELRRSNNKIERLLVTSVAKSSHNDETPLMTADPKSSIHNHSDHHIAAQEHGHSHDDHDHHHDHHGHEHDHHHDDHHGHEHDHHHDDHHGHEHVEHGATGKTSPTNEVVEMKRRLHHLEWENSTFRNDLDKLAIEAKERRNFEENFNKMSEECRKLKTINNNTLLECQELESLVIQLQGENDTIGDYITLYQSQRLALKESAREKDLQLANLAKDRETLLKKMEELTQLLKVLQQQKGAVDHSSQSVHQCSHVSGPQNSTNDNGEHEIEGKIRNLLSEISSSSLIENFHPCAVCSGQLMNV